MDVQDFDVLVRIATSADRLYVASNNTSEQNYIYSYDYSGSLIPRERMAIPDTHNTRALFAYNGFLYRYTENKSLSRVDLTTVLLPEPDTVYPQLVRPGDRIDLWQFGKYFNSVVWGVGYDKPDFVSLAENRYIDIADDIEEGTTAYMNLRAINQNGITDADAFGFYIHVLAIPRPEWKTFDTLTLLIGQEINLLEYADAADAIDYQYNFTLPANVTLSDNKLTIDAEVDTTVSLRASNTYGYFEDKTFRVVGIQEFQEIDLDNNQARYRVEIEGIDVTSDLTVIPTTEASLDYLKLNAYVRGECEIVLIASDGKYNPLLSNNFWSDNGLNPSGYLNNIRLFIETAPFGSNPTWTAYLLFEGSILEFDETVADVEVTLGCVDSSYQFEQTQLSQSGLGLPKIAQLDPPDTAGFDTNEGNYTPENALVPLDVDGIRSAAYAHTHRLTLKQVANSIEGISRDNTGYLEADALKTQGGYYDEPLLLDFKTALRRIPLNAALTKIATLLPNYTVISDVEPISTDWHIATHGNVGFIDGFWQDTANPYGLGG